MSLQPQSDLLPTEHFPLSSRTQRHCTRARDLKGLDNLFQLTCDPAWKFNWLNSQELVIPDTVQISDESVWDHSCEDASSSCTPGSCSQTFPIQMCFILQTEKSYKSHLNVYRNKFLTRQKIEMEIDTNHTVELKTWNIQLQFVCICFFIHLLMSGNVQMSSWVSFSPSYPGFSSSGSDKSFWCFLFFLS